MTKSAPPGIIAVVMRLHQLKVEFDAEQDFDRRQELFRAGLSSQLDYSAATSARASR